MCRRGSESRQTSRLQTLVGGHTLMPQNSWFDRYRKRLFKKILRSDKEQLVETSHFSNQIFLSRHQTVSRLNYNFIDCYHNSHGNRMLEKGLMVQILIFNNFDFHSQSNKQLYYKNLFFTHKQLWLQAIEHTNHFQAIHSRN